MAEALNTNEMVVWQVPDCAVVIGYPAVVLDAIRLEVLDGFYAFRHGGLEVGGVLFGTHVEGRVRIAAHRALDCEHAEGPAFALSAKDRDRFAALLRLPHTDSELRGLMAVGWYHSHTRSGIYLSPQDLHLHERYFREPWQVALVLRPSIAGTRAGFFALDRSGRMRAEASYREFDLEPLSGRMLAPRATGPRPVAQPPLPEPATAPLPPPPPPLERAFWEEPPAPSDGSGTDPAPEAARVDPPSFLLAAPVKPRWRRLRLAVVMLAVAVAAAALTRDSWLPYLPAMPALRSEGKVLTAVDSGGQLLIRWDHGAGPVRQAPRGALEIVEGSDTSVVMLDRAALDAGSFTYARRSDRVDIRLKLEQPGGGRIEQYAGYLGAPPAPGSADSELRRQRDALAEELREARLQLMNQALLIRRLRSGEEDPEGAGSAPTGAR